MKKKEKMAMICTHCALLTEQNTKTALYPHVNKSVFDVSRSLSFSFGDSVAYNLIRRATTTVIIARIIFIRRLEIVKQFLLKY